MCADTPTPDLPAGQEPNNGDLLLIPGPEDIQGWLDQKERLETEIKQLRRKYRNDYCSSVTWEERQRILLWFSDHVRQVNRRIFDFNRQSPSARLRLALLDASKELAGVLPGSLGGSDISGRG
jgi:hypothetical protein